MSEFQCYKFKTVDRPLTDSERREVNALSSRGQVTSNSATFIYHYSDFRHNPETVLEKYFDAMLYFTNWGTRRLMFRLPSKLTDGDAIEKYCYEDNWGSNHIELKRQGEFYLLDIQFSDEEGGGWMEDDDFDLGDLTPLRDDILNGDYRALYLAWAKFSQSPTEDDEEDEDDEDLPGPNSPPVPVNLKRMSGPLKAFTGFFEIDDDLVAAAQSVSPDSKASTVEYEKLLAKLPENERLEWLARLLKSEPRLDVQLKKRLEKSVPAAPAPASPTASPAQLKALRAEMEEERWAREAAEARAAHVKKMERLEREEEDIWNNIPLELKERTAKAYDRVTETLSGLKELAAFQGRAEAFRGRMLEMKWGYSRRGTLIARWEKAGLFR